jgi:DNA-binding CsgD family transcriptional regulator
MEDAVDRVIGTIYDAALGALSWSEALTAVSEAVGAVGVLVTPVSEATGGLGLHSADIDSVVADYDSEWRRLDIRVAAGRRLAGSRELITERTLGIDRAVIDRHPFYQEFLHPRGYGGVAAVGFTAADGARHAVAAQRALDRGEFTPEECRRMALLGRHLGRAIGISGLFERMLAETEATGAALTGLGHGLIFLDAEGRLVDLDRLAERLLGRIARIGGGRIEVIDRRHAETVGRFFATARPGGLPATPVLVPTDDGPLLIQQLPDGSDGLLGALHGAEGRRLTVVSITRLDARRDLDLQRLLIGRGLTPNEARIARDLGAGETPRSIAERRGLSEQTIRHVAKSIYQKLDVGRHTELAVRITRLAACLIAPDGA